MEVMLLCVYVRHVWNVPCIIIVQKYVRKLKKKWVKRLVYIAKMYYYLSILLQSEMKLRFTTEVMV